MKRLFLFAKHLHGFRRGFYFTCSFVQQYFQLLSYCYCDDYIFLDIHPMGRAVAKLENKKKT